MLIKTSFIKRNYYGYIKLLEIIFLLLIYIRVKIEKTHNLLLNQDLIDENEVKLYPFYEIINIHIDNKTILIFEPNSFHYECTPGYAKYFVDLGYNVDVLMQKSGQDSFCLFEQKEKIRLFLYDDLKEINFFSFNLSYIFNFYSFIIVQTVSTAKIKTISNLGLLNHRNVIYVFHYTYYYKKLNYFKYNINQNRIWILGNFQLGLRVVPHYIGKMKLRDKNKKTRFFTVSTSSRNYNNLIAASQRIKEENLNFDIVVVGKSKKLSIKNINEKIKKNFLFSYRINFYTLYKLLQSSDFIILTMDPDNKGDESYKNQRVTGAAQLSYGFLKPVLINEYYKYIYNMTKENSFLYNKNNFYNIMKEAVLLNNDKYKIMQKNLINVEKFFYNYSINNIKRTINSLLDNR